MAATAEQTMELGRSGAAVAAILDELVGAGFIPEEVEEDATRAIADFREAWKAAS